MHENHEKGVDKEYEDFANGIKFLLEEFKKTGPFQMIDFLKDKFPENVPDLTEQDRQDFPIVDDLEQQGKDANASILIISILSKFHDMGEREGQVAGSIEAAATVIGATPLDRKHSPEHIKLVAEHDNAKRGLRMMQQNNAKRATRYADLLVRVINKIVEERMKSTSKVSSN